MEAAWGCGELTEDGAGFKGGPRAEEGEGAAAGHRPAVPNEQISHAAPKAAHGRARQHHHLATTGLLLNQLHLTYS